ncbi:MAG: PDZ domain-containing protein [Candidatus Zixiibacteriota bacterium]
MSKSKRIRTGFLFVVVALTLSLGISATAQDKQSVSIQVDSSYQIVELGASVESTPDGPRVLRVIPPAARLEKYRQIDIKTGDCIVSAGGESVKTLEELGRVLSAAKPGEEIRLGILRKGSPVVVTYAAATNDEIAAARELSAQPITEVTIEEGGPTQGRMMFRVEADENSVPWPEMAVLLSNDDGKVVVKQKLPMPPDFPIPATLLEGDVVTALQGQPVSNALDLTERYNQCREGDTIALSVESKGQTSNLTFIKPKGPTGLIRIRK